MTQIHAVRLALLFAFLSTSAGTAEAQQGNRRERATDVGERVDDRRDLRRDRAHHEAIVSIEQQWRTGVAKGDRAAEREADALLAQWLRRELAESGHEVGEARRERDRSRHERNRSRRERRRSGDGDDRRDLRDDRRDLRDDRRDHRVERRDLARTASVTRELRALQPGFAAGRATPADYQRKGVLLAELVRLARAELARDRRELREDRRETREDRRERREDRRRRR